MPLKASRRPRKRLWRQKPPLTTYEEQESWSYFRATRFASEETAGGVYFQIDALLYNEPECDLSVIRFLLAEVPHVAVLGDPPPEGLEEKLEEILSVGEPTSLPDEVLNLLRQRRAQAIKEGSWVERHYRPGKRL